MNDQAFRAFDTNESGPSSLGHDIFFFFDDVDDSTYRAKRSSFDMAGGGLRTFVFCYKPNK